MAEEPQMDIRQLVREHQAGVWRYLRLLGCDHQKADDLTQEVFIQVLKRPFDNYSPEATAAYLRNGAKLAFLSSLRKAERRKAVVYVDAADLVWAETAGKDEGSEQLDALDRCLEELNERERQVIDYRYRDEESREAIAERLELSPDGAKNLLQRTKTKLRECMKRRMER